MKQKQIVLSLVIVAGILLASFHPAFAHGKKNSNPKVYLNIPLYSRIVEPAKFRGVQFKKDRHRHGQYRHYNKIKSPCWAKKKIIKKPRVKNHYIHPGSRYQWHYR